MLKTETAHERKNEQTYKCQSCVCVCVYNIYLQATRNKKEAESVVILNADFIWKKEKNPANFIASGKLFTSLKVHPQRKVTALKQPSCALRSQISRWKCLY